MTTEFCRAVREATGKPVGLWQLAKWGRHSHTPPPPPQFPPLRDPLTGITQTDSRDKVATLRHVFFLEPQPADLEDVQGYNYMEPLEDSPEITPAELKEVIFKLAQDKAPGPDGITHHILQLLYKDMADQLRELFNACIQQGHHPHCFRDATTIALRKPAKQDYREPKVWCPITLLNTLGKTLEVVVAWRLRYIAERYALLPQAQHGCHQQRDTTTALELLTEQVHTAWGQGHDKVATLLSLDMAAAFPNVSHDCLLHILQWDQIPTALLNWTASFLKDRQTSLVLGRWQSKPHQISTGIPQGSPVSPILFLFFNKDLVDFCTWSTGKVTGIGFVDDVNILVVGNSTESNCWTLEHVHRGCKQWVDCHGATFTPHKYELMHLTRSPKKFNMAVGVDLGGGVTKAPQPTVQILGVLLDTKLWWGPHVKRTVEKAAQQSWALSAIMGSTWGATCDKAWLIYNMVVRPVLTYRVTVWTPLEGLLQPTHQHWIGDILEHQQQHCLRSVTGGFRVTSRKQLESEAAVPPLRTHMARLQLQAHTRMEASGVWAEIQEACSRIRRQLA